MVSVMTPSRWVRAGLLLGVTWVLGVLAAGFLLNRVITISRSYDEISARQAVEARLVQALRDSLPGQLGAEQAPQRFFVPEARAGVQAEYLLSIVVGDARETVVHFVNLHHRLVEEFCQGAGNSSLGAGGARLRGLIAAVARHLDERREAEKVALRASRGKAGLCFVVAFLFVGAVYLLVAAVITRVRQELPFAGALRDGLAA
jgi:hypothetical protein